MKTLSEWIKERIKSIQEGMRHVEDQSLSRYQWYELAMKEVLAELKASEAKALNPSRNKRPHDARTRYRKT